MIHVKHVIPTGVRACREPSSRMAAFWNNVMHVKHVIPTGVRACREPSSRMAAFWNNVMHVKHVIPTGLPWSAWVAPVRWLTALK